MQVQTTFVNGENPFRPVELKEPRERIKDLLDKRPDIKARQIAVALGMKMHAVLNCLVSLRLARVITKSKGRPSTYRITS